jgi:hypothetical protein
LKLRSTLLVALAGGASAFLFLAPASALDLGAVSVPVPVLLPAPPVPLRHPNVPANPVKVKVAVTLPAAVRVGPIVVDTGRVAPGLGASVSASPSDGLDVDVTLPTSVLPVAVPGAVPGSVHAHVDGGGVKVSTPVGGVTLPNPAPGVTAPGVPTDVTIPGVPSVPVISGAPDGSLPTTAVGATTQSGAPTGASPAAGSGPAGIRSTGPRASASVSADGWQRAHASTRGAAPATIEQPFGSVNAALQRPAPEQSSALWRAIDAVTSRGVLMVALLAIVLVARFAAAGLLRDALRRTRSVSAS